MVTEESQFKVLSLHIGLPIEFDAASNAEVIKFQVRKVN
jgi:hypothetical protein